MGYAQARQRQGSGSTSSPLFACRLLPKNKVRCFERASEGSEPGFEMLRFGREIKLWAVALWRTGNMYLEVLCERQLERFDEEVEEKWWLPEATHAKPLPRPGWTREDVQKMKATA